MTRHKLNRRTFLRGSVGAGTAVVALPLLEIMLNNHGTALAAGEELPTRFMTWFFGNGVILDQFEPAATGPNYPLSPELMPLAGLSDYVTVLTGLRNRCEQLITHHEGMTVFNGHTMIEINGLFSKAGGPTIDQLIAAKIAADTPIASVHMGVSKHLSVMDSGTTMFALSHKGPNEPQYPEFDPQKVWTQLFGSFQPKPDDRTLRMSVLDIVRDQTARLRPRLGKLDNERLDAHLDGVNALEKKITAIPPSCMLPGMPTETNQDMNGQEPITNVNDVMSDLLVYAFTCDITRVASMLFLGGAAETVFGEIGQTGGHHNNTHDWKEQDQVHDAVVFIMERFASMLTKFKAAVDIDGKNLLDTSIIYCSSDCSEGFSHSVERQPILLAGHGRDKLIYPAIHYQAIANGSAGNTSDVLLTCLQAFDPTATEIGSGDPMSTTPLTEIKGSG